MSLFGKFSEVEITTDYNLTGTAFTQFVKALEGLYAKVTPADLAWADAMGENFITIKKVYSDEYSDKPIRSVEVKGGGDIESVAEAAICLSLILASAPVSFRLNDIPVTATSADKVADVVVRFRQGMTENDRLSLESMADPTRGKGKKAALAANGSVGGGPTS